MTTANRLASLQDDGGAAMWRPQLFDLSDPAGRRALDDLLDAGAVARVTDTVAEQLADWVKAARPQRKWAAADLAAEAGRILAGRPAEEYGVWVFYPWTGVLCHVLPEAEFRFLRAARNQFKISPAEQEILAGKTVAVAGLSVGLAAATTMALEGVGRRFRLADFDTLGLSNLNRLRAGVADLGVNKAVLAARQLFEMDPYLRVELFPAGVTAATLADFLAPPLDLLVEECDDLAMKVRLREECRRRRIPVVMDTSDRGLIDVERFDREPDRPLLHGLIGAVRADDLAGLSAADKVLFGLRLLDPARLSVGLRASLPEVGQTVETWPQLASAVALGGGIVADAARRIFLGEFTASGRFYLDPADHVRDGAGVPVAPPPPPVVARPASAGPPRPPSASGPPTPDEVRFLAAHAAMAPSGGNSQPWRFEWRDGGLLGYVVPERRAQPLLDTAFHGCYAALGAAAENVLSAAAEIGLAAEVGVRPDPADALLAWRIRFDRRETRTDPLFAQIPLRVTNRKTGRRAPLTAEERTALATEAAARGGRLRLLESPAALGAVADLMGRCDRFLLLTPQGHHDTFRELRFDPAEVARTRDGLDVDSLEVPAAGRAALEVLADWRVMARVRQVGGGKALEDIARRAVAGSAAVGMLSVAGADPAAFVGGGRALQRLWLTATRLGLALHPWTGLPYLLARVESADRTGFTPEEWDWFAGLRDGYRALFPAAPDSSEVLLFRLGRADAPTARSLRRPLEDVLFMPR